MVPEEMEAKRNVSGCQLGVTGSYGDVSSIPSPETTEGITKVHSNSAQGDQLEP